MKENVFFDVNDGSCTKNLQILASKSVKKNLSYGASVDVCGILGLSPRGQLELQAESCHVIGIKDLYHMFYLNSNVGYFQTCLRKVSAK